VKEQSTYPMDSLPKMIRVRQRFAPTVPLDIPKAIGGEFDKLRPFIHPDDRIAVGVGSRGITNLAPIVSAVIGQIKRIGAKPFIIPAMGSHGGATPEGQREVLASYGVTEESMGVSIRDSLEVRQVGVTHNGTPAFCSTEALAADGILLINRIKPHTDFFGTLGSGLIKMSVIGLGKRTGATAMHLAAMQYGYEETLRAIASITLRNAPVLGGIAILENQFHETARLVALHRDEMEAAESELLAAARSMMPLLPFDEIDLLIIDAIGKNISGAGLDPNVVNRGIHGYSSFPMRDDRTSPFIRRIFVRDLTPQTHGNAIGIGMADATTTRLVRSADMAKTNINALTALTPQAAKLPIAFDSDRQAIEAMLASLPLRDPGAARIVRIADTLSVADMDVSESLWNSMESSPAMMQLGEARSMAFDHEGNLVSSAMFD
jgi:hypothetical protein